MNKKRIVAFTILKSILKSKNLFKKKYFNKNISTTSQDSPYDQNKMGHHNLLSRQDIHTVFIDREIKGINV